MGMSAVEKENYERCLESGNQFQDYVVSMLIKHKGIVLSNFSSRLFQWSIGEGYQGFEIKFDAPSERGENLLIETGERRSASGNWVKSGIHRDDNTDIYIIGNYEFFYVFDVKVLRRMEERSEFLRRHETDTGQFFLLRKSEIEKTVPYIYKIDCGEEGKKLLSQVKETQSF
uniref:Uncharacterized protein n=1 Tax=Candidatus Kentrum sp. SD TaxID=2126332 RepID=A0A450Z8F8_9GAMM|nr:MAG: hypothetical protein BECKSD772F_GA0070984_13482 [Candidatus Kentron sp. SD]VFK50083.1 MAG: hypothetical protein BECKSD772E_GA0070983_13382 [Candidatus Kentron sp. SD]VFK81337.1 MAG: hypothetical protein BECKSD772D_GA0070982_13142 [Candidatus Kentron sp. SD]